MVVAKFVAVYVDAVAPPMFVQVVLSGDDCHWMVPVFPAKVNNVEFVPLQSVVDAGVIDPATAAGFTVMTTLAVLAGAQTPLVTTAR